jgi:aerobic carbon-monoxide dehydrogenase large subunit
MAKAAKPKAWVGRALARAEDEALVTGRGTFVDDVKMPGALHLAFARSPHARAAIRGIDTAPARAMPGVVAVFLGADMAAPGPLAVNPVIAGLAVPPATLLARDRVRAVGQPVAAIVATTADAARDAAEALEVDYDTDDDAAPLYAELPGDVAATATWRAGEAQAAMRDAAAANAATIVRAIVRHARVAPLALEPRAALADFAGGRLTAWLAVQTPHRARDELARLLGLDAAAVRVIAPDIGGAFGGKAALSPEDAVVAFAARTLGRPVRWTATRGEDMAAASHGRGLVTEGALAVDADGRIWALTARIAAPLGHWLTFSAAVPAANAGRILPGPYAVPAVDIAAELRVTPTAAIGIYRGAGRPEATLLMERLMDEAARALDLDPVEIRRRNLVPAAAMPFTTATGQTLDSGDYPALLDAVLGAFDYAGMVRARARRRRRGEIVGLGVACYVEPCGQGWESARVALAPDGSIRAATGSSTQGQGRVTAYRQIVADAIECAPEAVTVVHGDTDATPPGIGALASRSTPIGGSAMLLAAREFRVRARAAAARLLQAREDQLALAADGFFVARAPGRRLSWAALAEAEPDLSGESRFETKRETWAAGACLAAVSVDGETGAVSVERFAWADDAGRVVNPLLVKGQLEGGFAQGLGAAFLERIVYDEDGQLLTGSLMDYALPRAADMPAVRLASRPAPTPLNPLGAKGAGEAGCIGPPAALMGAVADALAAAGADLPDPPLTGERIWRALAAAARKGRRR